MTTADATIKSATPVQAHGAGNNGNWVARIRYTGGKERFAGFGAGYTLHQAQAMISNARGEYESLDLVDLPTGVTIKA